MLQTGFERLLAAHVNFDGNVVELPEGLKLDVVAPDSVFGFVLDVLFNIPIYDVVLEVVFFRENVLHGEASQFLVVHFIPVELVRDGPKHTISVALDILNAHVGFLQHCLEGHFHLFVLHAGLPQIPDLSVEIETMLVAKLVLGKLSKKFSDSMVVRVKS